VKKKVATADQQPIAVFAHSVVETQVLADAMARLATNVIENGLGDRNSFPAAIELLFARPPRLNGGKFVRTPAETAVDFAERIAPELDRTVLPIQGPPGAGKTYTGAKMIVALARQGLRVGVTGTSHKVIRNLLEAVLKEAAEQAVGVRCGHKVGSDSDDELAIEDFTDNGKAIAAIRAGAINVLGATQWLWARPEVEALVDVLFVDEAGQMSLANALAASLSARSVVLIGDPQQLEQPQQASHPDGAEVSGLDHILQGHQTIGDEQGIFLPETWRLAPRICRFTSEVFYENKLHALDALKHQKLAGTAALDGAGLWLVPVEHHGNQNSSPEEQAAVEQLVDRLLKPAAVWINKQEVAEALAPKHILIVAPYNAQVGLLSERLAPRGIRIGTVDKFQGQEAPVVIYSMATSSPDDAPRGMEFLYSLNRLNVASSRARCACIIVASAKLLQPDCKSPKQMQLANGLCRYVELATALSLPANRRVVS
jgi:uncharacterized protein